MITTIKRLLTAIFWLTSTAVFAADTIEIAALYESQVVNNAPDINHENHTKLTTWRLWRHANKIEIDSENLPTGEVWKHLKDGEVAYTWLMHDKKFAINYAPSDLKSIENYPRWDVKASLISPDLLKQLNRTGNTTVLGYPAENYSGKVGQYRLDIVWIPQLHLPYKIRQKTADETSGIKLLAIYPLEKAPWQPHDYSQYEDMDFSDIGDNEAHPLVKRYQKGMNLMTLNYPHQH